MYWTVCKEIKSDSLKITKTKQPKRDKCPTFQRRIFQYFCKKQQQTVPGTAPVTGLCFMCILRGAGGTKVTLGSSKSEPNHGRVIQKHTLGENTDIVEKSSFRPSPGCFLDRFGSPPVPKYRKRGFPEALFFVHFPVPKKGGDAFRGRARKQAVVP